MEFGMSRTIKPKEKYVRISMKKIWGNLDNPTGVAKAMVCAIMYVGWCI